MLTEDSANSPAKNLQPNFAIESPKWNSCRTIDFYCKFSQNSTILELEPLYFWKYMAVNCPPHGAKAFLLVLVRVFVKVSLCKRYFCFLPVAKNHEYCWRKCICATIGPSTSKIHARACEWSLLGKIYMLRDVNVGTCKHRERGILHETYIKPKLNQCAAMLEG